MIRMSVNRILPFLLLLVLFTSCNRKYKIEGSSSVTSLDGKMLFLKTLRNGQWVNVDSAEVIHGHFKMKGRTDSVMMVTLYMDQEGIMPLVLEDGKIVVSISNTQLIAKGTSLNDKLYEFIDKRQFPRGKDRGAGTQRGAYGAGRLPIWMMCMEAVGKEGEHL